MGSDTRAKITCLKTMGKMLVLLSLVLSDISANIPISPSSAAPNYSTKKIQTQRCYFFDRHRYMILEILLLEKIKPPKSSVHPFANFFQKGNEKEVTKT
jgi:hypothetical protein